MPTVSLTKVAGSVSLSSEWVTIEDDGRVNIQNAVASEIAGPGIEITKIEIRGRARNSATATKQLRLGFKPALSSGRNTWSTVDGDAVLDSTFTAIGAAKVSGTYIYQTFTRTYDANNNAAAFALFSAHILASFAANTPVCLGIIQPTAGKSISVYISGYWTITITYNILGNVPTTDVDEATLGETEITTSIERIIPDSTTTLRYKIGDVLLDEFDIEDDEEHVYEPATSVGEYFPNAQTATLTIEAETFLDDVSYGVVSTTVTLKLPSDAAPTCTCTPEQLERVIPGVDAYVQGKSGVEFSVDGSAKYGASIAGYSLSFDGALFGDFPAEVPVLTNSGERPFTLTVTDSRGLTGTHTGSIFVHALQLPKIVAFACARATSDGTIDDDAEFVKYALSASVSSLYVDDLERNTLMYRIKSRPVNTLEWQANDDIYAAPSAVSVVDEGMIEHDSEIVTYTAYQGYDFMVEVFDLFGTSVANYTIPTNYRQFVLGADGKGVSFGGPVMGTTENPKGTFHVPVEFVGGIPQFDYSTDEVDTGLKFIDGKPLYARMLVINTINSDVYISHITDIAETILFESATMWATAGGKRYCFPPYYNGSSDFWRVYMTFTDGEIRVHASTNLTNTTTYIRLLYTKTAD